MVVIYLSPSLQEWNRGVDNYGTEEQRMNQLADKIEPMLKKHGFIVYRNRPSMTLSQAISDSNRKLGRKDLHLALHTNAGGGRGAEVYYYKGSTEGRKLADLIYNRISRITPTSDRGVHGNTTFVELRNTRSIATLTEFIFHDHPLDAQLMMTRMDDFAKAYVQAICEYTGVKYDGATPTPSASKETAVAVDVSDFDQLVRDTIAGKYGNGAERKRRLGKHYSEVQRRINNQILKKKDSVDYDKLVKDTIAGKYGNGNERKKRLGKHYNEVQKRINKIYGK